MEVASCRKSVIGTMFDILIIGDISYTAFKDSTNDDKWQDEIPRPMA
jgi:hypothetical protein